MPLAFTPEDFLVKYITEKGEKGKKERASRRKTQFSFHYFDSFGM